jgi:hypothetical protein
MAHVEGKEVAQGNASAAARHGSTASRSRGLVLLAGSLALVFGLAGVSTAEEPPLQHNHQDLCRNANDCDDKDPCNGFESCTFGHCTLGTPLDCDDNNVCTRDYCHPKQGCKNEANNAHCSDGNPCNGLEVCRGRVCRSGFPLRCGDGNDCTLDTCEPLFGCVYTPRDGGVCRDGGECVTDGECVAGECVGGEPLCDPVCERCEAGVCVPRCPDETGLRVARTASDALSILQTAVTDEDCDLCDCDLDGDGEVTATDALLGLRVAVGEAVDPVCPVPSTTSTTVTTTTTTSSTSVPPA